MDNDTYWRNKGNVAGYFNLEIFDIPGDSTIDVIDAIEAFQAPQYAKDLMMEYVSREIERENSYGGGKIANPFKDDSRVIDEDAFDTFVNKFENFKTVNILNLTNIEGDIRAYFQEYNERVSTEYRVADASIDMPAALERCLAFFERTNTCANQRKTYKGL